MSHMSYTPHFAVVGGPGPHPSGDGRMGVCLIVSKTLRKVEIEEELKAKEPRPWDILDAGLPEFQITITVTLDSRFREGHQYTLIWAENYREAWNSLFELWGEDVVPDNQKLLEEDEASLMRRKAITR